MGVYRFNSITPLIFMLQKHILGDDEMLKPIPPPLRVSQKLFEGKHAPDIQKSATVSRSVPESVPTFVETNSKLVLYLSSNLMQIRTSRQTLVLKA